MQNACRFRATQFGLDPASKSAESDGTRPKDNDHVNNTCRQTETEKRMEHDFLATRVLLSVYPWMPMASMSDRYTAVFEALEFDELSEKCDTERSACSMSSFLVG